MKAQSLLIASTSWVDIVMWVLILALTVGPLIESAGRGGGVGSGQRWCLAPGDTDAMAVARELWTR